MSKHKWHQHKRKKPSGGKTIVHEHYKERKNRSGDIDAVSDDWVQKLGESIYKKGVGVEKGNRGIESFFDYICSTDDDIDYEKERSKMIQSWKEKRKAFLEGLENKMKIKILDTRIMRIRIDKDKKLVYDVNVILCDDGKVFYLCGCGHKKKKEEDFCSHIKYAWQDLNAHKAELKEEYKFKNK